MKLIEADKVEQAIKDYWKAQVDKALTLTDGNEKRINIYLEHNHELLKAIDELPSAQPDIIRCKDCKWYGRADKRRFYRGMDCLQKRIDTIVPDRDFCSRAERKKNGL